MTCLDFKVVTNVADRDGKAEIIGHTEDGPASVLLPAKDLPSIMASLSVIEEELNAGTTYYSRPAFHYKGFETRIVESQNEAGLLIHCIPDIGFAFLMSPDQMMEVGQACVMTAKQMKKRPGRPN